MELIDTHTHLYLNDFDQDLDQVILRAVKAGVTKLLLPAIDSSHTSSIHRVCSSYPNYCFPMIGLHPTSVNDHYKQELQHVETELLSQEYIAIGEIGIDLYWDKTFIIQQTEALHYQLELAEMYALPVVIHTRNSFDETWSVLSHFNTVKGVFHCFSGTTDQAYKVIEKGFKIGVGGVVSYKNAILAEVVREIGIEHIVLETDSPYLSPVPYRGKRNESSYLKEIALKVAEIKKIPFLTVAEQTSANAEQIFDKVKKFN